MHLVSRRNRTLATGYDRQMYKMIRLSLAILALSLFAPGLVSVANAQPTAQPPTVEDTMAQRMQACSVCHGEEGRASGSEYFPRIAGKPAGYLHNQLRNFQQGLRRHAAMEHLLQHLSDDYLREIAEHFAGLDLPWPPARPHGLNEADRKLAEKLVFDGRPDRDLPACVACHGQAMAGVAPAMPGLLSLPADYLLAQFGAWREGLRTAAAPDCMADIAKRLEPAEIAAVSRWLSAQTLPPGTKPADATPEPLPMRCGSTMAAIEPTAAGGSAPVTAEVARGAYLARAGNCVGCHTRTGGAPYAGGRGLETPFGTIYATNLTPDAQTGLGNWTADEFWRAMHEGRSKDGRLLNPAFPYPNFTLITREDSDALFAYLKQLAPVHAPNRAHDLRFPYDTQAALAVWRTLFFKPGALADDPSRDAQWNRGRYLVEGLGHCTACHSGRNALGATRPEAEFTGSTIEGNNWYAPSLADPREAGVQDWAHGDIVALLRDGRTDKASVSGPMAEVVATGTRYLSEADLAAMASYLASIPKQTPTRPAPEASASGTLANGQRLYREHCASCHGQDGAGVPGIYPALAGNRAVVLDKPTNLIQMIRKGGFAPATPGNPRPFGMPPYGHLLNDEEIAAVASYVRQSWGNRAAGVSGLEVGRLR